MVIIRTSAVLASIQAVSPESTLGGSSANAGVASSRSGSMAATTHESRCRIIVMVSPTLCRSECGGVGLAGADAHRPFDVDDKDLAVADLAGVRCLGDRLDHLVGEIVGHDNLDLHLRQEVH